MILTTHIGVPVIMTEDSKIVNLTHMQAQDVLVEALDNPALLDGLFSVIKDAIHEVSGIDPMLDDDDWWGEFNRLLVINEFTTPLHVLSQVRREVERVNSEEWDRAEEGR